MDIFFDEAHRDIFRVSAGQHAPGDLLVRIDEHTVALSHDLNTFTFDRITAISSLQVSTYGEFDLLSWIRRKPTYSVIAEFKNRKAHDDGPPDTGSHGLETVAIRFDAWSLKHAQKIRRQLLEALSWEGAPALVDPRPGFRKPKSRKKSVLIWLAALGISAYLASTLLSGPPAPKREIAAWGTAQMPAYGYLTEDQQAALEFGAKEVGLDLSGFDKGPPAGAIPFYVFSTPDCDDCALIDQALPRVDHKYFPIIIPAPRSTSTVEVAGTLSAYCDGHPAAAWLLMSVSGAVPVDAAACDTGIQKLRAASVLKNFLNLGPEELPVIIAPNGAIFSGSLAHIEPERRADAITEWLDANTKKSQ